MKQHPANRRRAKRIADLLQACTEYDGKLDWRATITDALSDLRHLCDAKNLAFHECDESAYRHYTAEKKPDDIELGRRIAERNRICRNARH